MTIGPALQRPRVLYLLPFPPRLDGVHGGSRATAELLLRLTSRHPAALLYLCADGEPPLDERLAEQCALAVDVRRPARQPLSRREVTRRAAVLARCAAGQPHWVAKWNVPEVHQRLRALVREWQPDVVQFDFHVMGQYLPALCGWTGPRVMVAHEPASTVAPNSARGVGRWLHRLQAATWRRYERRVLDAVDAVVVFTPQDRDALRELGSRTPVRIIPLGAEVPVQPLDPCGESPPRLLFVGNYMHPPNRDAAIRMVRDIFPALRELVPDLHLDLVGDHPPADVLDAADPHVHVHGRVPDVHPYFDRAALVVAPLRHGGGMRVKILEALAAGKAVVATPLAVAGLDVTDGEHLAVAETDAEFAAAVERLLRDREARVRLGGAAHTWAAEHLDWDRSAAAYSALYDALLAKDPTAWAPQDPMERA